MQPFPLAGRVTVPRKRGRKIRKSHEIVLGVAMLSLVAALAGCDDSAQPRRCVDSNGQVVSEDQCRNEETRRYYYGGPPIFFWYYGGGGGYAPGNLARGGYSTAPYGYGGGRFSGSAGEGHSGAGTFGGSVSRGGFGASAAAHGGGGIGG